MANFYIVLYKQEKPKFDVHVEGILLNNVKEVIPVIFNKGRSLKDFLQNQFYIEKDDKYSKIGKYRDKLSTIVNTTNPLFVGSRKLEFLLKEIASSQVEFFNLTIFNSGVNISDYKILNIINKIDCIDYVESEVNFEFYDDEVPSGDIISTDRLVIKLELIPEGLYIFLLGRYKDEIVIIHERLKNAIIERGLTGFVFCKIDDFEN
jgi:hypothetical protein